MVAVSSQKFRRGNTFSIDLPTLPSTTAQPRAFELRQAKYEHDILILTFLTSSHQWYDSLRTGVPIKLTWGTDATTKEWYGYVSFVTRSTSASSENIMEVHCVGASFPLKERTTRVFTDTTIPDAVKAIVEGFGFNYIGEPDSRVFPQLSIAGHSYWEWIQEQAKRIGYGVLVDGLNFVFRPLDSLINQGVTSVPILEFSGSSIARGRQLYDRTLDVFIVSNGEFVEDFSALRANKVVGGVNPVDGSVVIGSASPKTVGQGLRTEVNDVLFSEIRSEQVVHSSQDGESASSGAAHVARMNMPAKAVCQGDVRVRPFYPVYIRGTGDTTDGFWIPTQAIHTVTREGQYQIRMNLGIDGTGLNSVTLDRPDVNTRVGVVDFNEALRNNGVNLNAANSGTVSLVYPGTTVNERIQGFNRAGARWTYNSSRSN